MTTELKPGGICSISFEKEPVNAMDLDFWQELLNHLKTLEHKPEVKALIFSSGLKRPVFTAGNDLKELYTPLTSLERFRDFWSAQTEVFRQLLKSRLITVAAIRGAAPAGGCALALCCDHRLMTPEGVIGLNEVALGIPVPRYWAELFRRRGGSASEKFLLRGSLIQSYEAQRSGLVDQIVEASDLLDAAQNYILSELKTAQLAARAQTKLYLNEALAESWWGNLKAEIEQSWELLSQPATVKALGQVLESLKKPSK